MNEGWIKQDRENRDIRDKIESTERHLNLRVLKIENYIPHTLEGTVIKQLIDEKVTFTNDDLVEKINSLSKNINK